MDLLIHDEKLDTAERVELIASYLLQLSIIIAIIRFVYLENWINVFLSGGILLVTFLPAILRRSLKVHLPVEIDLLTIFFIYVTLFLGEVHAYYTLFWWWDLVLHGSSGILFGIAGYLLVSILNAEERIHFKMRPGFIALFSFAFALMISALWEVFEFAMDQLLGFTMQHNSLVDTMGDLIIDSIGALIIAVLGFFYSKKGHSLLFDRMIHRFVERNPQLFKKRKLLA